MLGKRAVKVWDQIEWVTVRATQEANNYRIVPDDGDEFEVLAENEEQLDDEIVRAMRRE